MAIGLSYINSGTVPPNVGQNHTHEPSSWESVRRRICGDETASHMPAWVSIAWQIDERKEESSREGKMCRKNNEM